MKVGRTTPRLHLAGTSACMAFALRRTARAISRHYDDQLRACGLRVSQLTILIALAKSGPVSMTELAATIHVDATTLSRNLRPMARSGWLEICARGAGRHRSVALKPVGRRVLARALPRWRRTQRRMLAAYGAVDWNRLRADLDRLLYAPERRHSGTRNRP
ncbi:MAG: MarR family winged helix-turn-helix transcriptional regulator [Steroidobacteraceae bacterium]